MLRNSIKPLWFTGLILCFLFALSCRNASDPSFDDIIVIDFWHAMGGEHGPLINQYAREFEKMYPGVRVNPVYQGNYAQLQQKIIASITAGQIPTMAQMYESWTVRFLELDYLEHVADFFSLPDDGFTQDEIQDIVKVFVEDNSYNGKMVTMPFNKSAYVLFVNMDLLKQAGYEEPPVTWEEMRDISLKVTNRDKNNPVYGFAVRPFIETFSTVLYISSHRFIDNEGNPIFDDEKGLRALQFIYDLVQKDRVAYIESTYLSTPFGSGKIAMFIGSTAGIPFVEKAIGDKFEWRLARIPSPTGEPGRVLFQGTNIGIFSGGTEEQRLYAWRFLKYITSTEIATRWSIDSGYLPIRYSCLNTPEMRKFLEENPYYKVVVDQLDYGIFEPREPYWEVLREVITDEVDATLNGRVSVDEALSRAVQKSKIIIDSLK